MDIIALSRSKFYVIIRIMEYEEWIDFCYLVFFWRIETLKDVRTKEYSGVGREREMFLIIVINFISKKNEDETTQLEFPSKLVQY